MALTFEAARRLFTFGQFAELLRQTDLNLSATRGLAGEHRVLVAHVLALTGDLKRARELALSVGERETTRVRSEAHLVMGLVEEQLRALSRAYEHFQSAVRFAKLAADDEQIAWTSLRLFRHAIDGDTPNVLPGMLAEVRRVVTRAADPRASAYLHQCVAVLEGQTGRLEEAQRHCSIVESLLTTAPNAWLSSGNLLLMASLAALDYRFDQAVDYIHRARPYIAESANARSGGADATLGHIQLLTGDFDKALASFDRAINSAHPSRFAALAGFDGLAHLYLALGRLSECNEVLRLLETHTTNEPGFAGFYSCRWAKLTKARYLLRIAQPEAAIAFLKEVERSTRGMSDVPFSVALHLALAQAAAAIGIDELIQTRLLLAGLSGASKLRQLQADYYFVSASVLPEDCAQLRHQLRHRAFRVWRHQGVISVPLELRKLYRLPGAGRIRRTPRSAATVTAMSVVDSIAQLFNLGHAPRLLADEVLSVIHLSGCSTNSEVFEHQLDSAPVDENCIRLQIAPQDGKGLTIVCSRPGDAADALVLAGIQRLVDAARELEYARQQEGRSAALWPAVPFDKVGGSLFVSEEMQSLLATARRVAATNVPVLITGETGTGKEVLARTIHACSARAKGAFVPFNCTSTPKDMLDSQLFGHRRGSFTGAVDNFQGVIRAAGAGTLFLDEIGDMPLEAQPKLLRFLESGEVHPVGDAQPVRADVRVIAATNANLDALVTAGRFREDLFYRLNIVQLHLPPLRERRMEIPTLATHYLEKYAKEYGKGELRLAEETMEYLLLYRWPGNVRQLANEMRRMAALCESGAVLMPEHLSVDIAASRRTIPASSRVLDATEVVVRLDQPLPAAIEHVERAMLQYALKKCGGRMEETAALLGLSRKGLYLKRHRFGIDPPESRTAAGAA